jgi:hypothetical protein
MAEESIKELTNLFWAKKTEIAALNKVVKELTTEKNDYETRLIQAMEATGIDMARNDDATFTVNSEIVAVPKDWEQIHKWVMETGNLQIFMRRIMSKSYQELLEIGEEIPGVEQMNKTSIRTKTRK